MVIFAKYTRQIVEPIEGAIIFWTDESARDWTIVAVERGFDRSLAGLRDKGLEGLDDRFSEVRFCFFLDASRLGARQVMGLGVLMKGSPLAGEIT